MVGFSALLLVTQVWRFVDRQDRNQARLDAQMEAARMNAQLLAAPTLHEPSMVVLPAMAPLFDPPRLKALQPKGQLYAFVISADQVVLADHGVDGALVVAARTARQLLSNARAQGSEVMPQAPRVWKGGTWQLTEP